MVCGTIVLKLYTLNMHVTIGILLFWGCYLVTSQQFPEVEIESGIVSGTLSKTWKGRTIYQFEGIPYAAPPVGELRFQEAIPIEPWSGVLNASAPGSACVQYSHVLYSLIGDEDCLFINVYTPKLPQNLRNYKLLNVLVYIHGGAFMFLDGSAYGPDYLLDKDIIFVTFNYRLGPIGFFSTGDAIVPGNNGMKDQVHALKWVKRNIEFFGGNPNDITISGSSAGGASVHHHMVSHLSKGLFQKAISQSGTAFNPWAIAEDVPEKSAAIGASLGCPTHPSSEMVRCLNTKPAKDIVIAVKMFIPFLYNPSSPFGPIVEIPSRKAFIYEHPYTTLAKGLSADVPWLTSMTTHEGLYPGSEVINDAHLLDYIHENWNLIMPHMLDYNYTAPTRKLNFISQRIRNEYLGSIELYPGKTNEFIQMLSDRLFIADIIKAVKLQARLYQSPVYLYQFGYRGTHSTSEWLSKSNQNYGACHADDTAYALKYVYLNVEKSEADKVVALIMINIWTSFVLTGIPSTGMRYINWTPVNKKPYQLSASFLKIYSPGNIRMVEDEQVGKIWFWNSLNLNENEHYSLLERLFPIKY